MGLAGTVGSGDKILDVQFCLCQTRYLLLQKYFCTVYDYVGKADLSKGYWNVK